MGLLKGLLIGIVLLLAAAVGVGLMLPDTAHVERSITIESPPATVYVALNGFGQFDRWSPWAQLDPEADYRVEGAPMGVGARMSWHSENPAVGGGSQRIVESVPNRRIVIELTFDGFDSENRSAFELAPVEHGTRLTWSYDTRFDGNLLNRYFGLLLDGMIGPDYEKGLVELKRLIEQELPATDFSGLAVDIREVSSRPMIYRSAAAEADQIPATLAQCFGELSRFVEQHALQIAGEPFAITRQYDDESGFWRFDAAYALDQRPGEEQDGIKIGTTYEGWVLVAEHDGEWATLPRVYERLAAYRDVAGLDDNGDSWEEYVAPPGMLPIDPVVTRVYWPVR